MSLFVRRFSIERLQPGGIFTPCHALARQLFMRNFTNDAIFDDTLPVVDGLMEADLRVPSELLQRRMRTGSRRKGYLSADEALYMTEQ